MTQQETVDTNTDVEGKVPPGLVDQVHEERVSASVPPLGPPDSSQEEGTDLQDHHRVPGTKEINNKPCGRPQKNITVAVATATVGRGQGRGVAQTDLTPVHATPERLRNIFYHFDISNYTKKNF